MFAWRGDGCLLTFPACSAAEKSTKRRAAGPDPGTPRRPRGRGGVRLFLGRLAAGYGVAAAFFTALLGGAYYYLNDAMCTNLVTSQFLLVMALASLVVAYRSPSARNGLSLAILGSAVVLYHPVATMYLAALLVLVGLFFVLPLVFRDRPRGVALMLSLALLGVLSVAYAWHTYGLGGEASQLLGGLVDGRPGARPGRRSAWRSTPRPSTPKDSWSGRWSHNPWPGSASSGPSC